MLSVKLKVLNWSEIVYGHAEYFYEKSWTLHGWNA